MPAKYVNFINNLTNVVGSFDTNSVKAELGDSTNNHRVLTVSQVLRYLRSSDDRQLKRLAKNLQSVYGITRNSIKQVRSEGRSDAVDINEFINFYFSEVVGKGVNRTQVSRAL